jgi:hypothetical protein
VARPGRPPLCPSRTEREPTRPTLDGPESVPGPRGPGPDVSSPSRAEREPFARRGRGRSRTHPRPSGQTGLGPGLGRSRMAQTCWDVLGLPMSVLDVLGLAACWRLPAGTRGSVGPAQWARARPRLGWIRDEASRGGIVITITILL